METPWTIRLYRNIIKAGLVHQHAFEKWKTVRWMNLINSNENFIVFFRILFGVVIIQNIFLALVLLCYYYILAYIMQIKTTFLYISYYILNTTSLFFTIEYITFVYSTRSRIHIINRLLEQLLFNTNIIVKNTSTPIIAYSEIYSIYGREPNKSSFKKDQPIDTRNTKKVSQIELFRKMFKNDIL